ncbi:MAG: hypothetical protein AVDCRST_MAG77-5732 [uncultured Chloroflexi bacterium]|uniref:Cyclic nucleotide-binding domain-containing protein n=1 Tax=uncultured Chloroflexota bacterium TaxID=166587 RepID=A0A6J4KD73_9CHLR|nr:MAG: hypothetical protein AVDCRST_MAG77-5732 [uncultured Chloroflexota bacterium]
MVGDVESDRATQRAALLSTVDLFSGLSRVALAKIAASLDPVQLADHEPACVQGDPGDSMYIVSGGSLGVFILPDGVHEARVATLGPGACFGEMALLTGEPRSATVRALGAAEALRLERERFVDLLRREPAIGLAISATLSRRLRDANQAMSQDKQAIVRAVAVQLESLPPGRRAQVLHAAVLEQPSLPGLRALFDGEAEAVAGSLGVLGVDVTAGSAPVPVLRALRDLLEQEQGADGKRERQREAIARLGVTGRWDDALALLVRVGSREELLQALGTALHASPPLAPEEATRWIAQVEDHEAATHHALALQRARWHEQRGDLAAALAVLQRVETPAPGHEDGSWQQLAQETERLRALYGAVVEAPVRGSRRADALSAARRRLSARPGTLLTVLVAVAFAIAAGLAGRAWQAPEWAFIFLLGAAIALWVTALLPDFLVCAGLVIGWVLCGVATPAQALAGFGTPSWTTALAILSLAAAISSSGLLFRFGLLLVRRMPDGLFAQAATFLFTGILLTPLLPSSTARSGLAVPLALTAAQAQRLKERSPESAMLGLAAYIGANPLLFMFLNGSTSCLLALGLAPEATRAKFDFVHWLLAALPLAVLVALGSLVMMWLLLRPGRVERASRAQLNLQLSLLGKPSAKEIAMTVILLLTVAGWNVGPALGLHPSTIGLVSVLAASIAGCFTRASLQGLNWDFLVAYGPILTISQLVTSLGVDKMAAGVVSRMVGEGGVPPVVFILLVAVLCLVVRVFLPQDQALLLLALALLPAAPVVGVDPWIILITLLATFSLWYFPSQTVGYLVAYDASEERLFTHRQAQLVSYGFTAVVLVSLALCVPYWALLGLV